MELPSHPGNLTGEKAGRRPRRVIGVLRKASRLEQQCAGAKLVVPDAHERLKAAISKVLNATW